jgi:Putative transposase/Transposase zinc-binding domain
MNRPPLEVADIVRCAGQSFVERSRKWINSQHEKVLLAITRCRTAALGGHRDQCSDCGHTAISYNSCRNRHCPRCQGNARQRWLQARGRELLPASYVHVVFTLPRELAPLALQNKQLIYYLLFHTSAQTLLQIASDPRHLGAEIAFFSVLHTWDQRRQHHPHVHCVLAAGGLAPDHSRWISSRRSFFLPVKVLSRVFRGKFVAGLSSAFREGTLQFHGHLLPLAEPHAFASWLRLLFRHDWVVYAKPPFGGPEHALRYLGAYTHRVAISNSRLVALSKGNVTFRWRDSTHGNKKRIMTLTVEQFLRRFLLHLLPRGFVRIRNFGFLANRRRAELLPVCFRLLQQSDQPAAGTHSPAALPIHSLWQCPLCGGTMQVVERLSAAQLLLSASSQPVRRLNAHLQPRISLLLRRAYWLCVSHSSQCSMVLRFRLSDAPPHDHSLCDPLLKPKRSDHNGKLANDQDRLIQIQIP